MAQMVEKLHATTNPKENEQKFDRSLGVPYHIANSDVNMIDLVIYATLADGSFEHHFRPNPRNDVVFALLPVRHGVIAELLKPDLESDYEIEWQVKVGMTVKPGSLVSNAGLIKMKNLDRDALRRDFYRLNDYQTMRCLPLHEGEAITKTNAL